MSVLGRVEKLSLLMQLRGLNITVMSLNGRLGIGVISSPDLVDDVWDLADAFPVALEELLQI